MGAAAAKIFVVSRLSLKAQRHHQLARVAARKPIFLRHRWLSTSLAIKSRIVRGRGVFLSLIWRCTASLCSSSRCGGSSHSGYIVRHQLSEQPQKLSLSEIQDTWTDLDYSSRFQNDDPRDALMDKVAWGAI